ncbi:hypothetical protein NQ317_016163 [Molorchus minor]|uniref:GH18 domain-containing protein n=1 Tax=Molorchus minor TaxID=1323400 RepID=A0ABQ9IQ61_9CUCU|nr:hypothetical protein NQ317_016163 [Molorchus minor]
MFGYKGLSTNYTVAILDSWESDSDGGYSKYDFLCFASVMVMGMEQWESQLKLNTADPEGFHNLVALKQSNPNLKVMVSMGGWNEGSGKYSQLAADPIKRQVLAKDVLRFIQEHGFDGFDLDWEYPGLRDNPDIEHDKILKLYSLQMDIYFPPSVGGGVPTIDVAYDVPAVSDDLKFSTPNADGNWIGLHFEQNSSELGLRAHGCHQFKEDCTLYRSVQNPEDDFIPSLFLQCPGFNKRDGIRFPWCIRRLRWTLFSLYASSLDSDDLKNWNAETEESSTGWILELIQKK